MISLAISALTVGPTHFMLIMTNSDSSSNSNVKLLPQLFPQRRRAQCGQDSQACLGPGPASAVMTWELWGPTDVMGTLPPREGPCGLVQRAQHLAGQKGSVTVHHHRCGRQDNDSKDIHTLIPETYEYGTLPGKGTLQA